ncbi:unnamed protein product [Lasius platythorax]|uniref:Secreted protein n=1 Tax=Lasius platythorax TaxID=488582 RepID=A0AAV2N5H3_9HYME
MNLVANIVIALYTPFPTVFINSHHCLVDANQLPSGPCERGLPNWNREKVGVFRWGTASFQVALANSCQPFGDGNFLSH